jgi:AraC family transcriptional regulator of adaptative response / DNA-3-methyladenine glycosylase II
VAQTRRFLFAKRLIDETRLSMTEVAMAAGFGSLRRFNDVFRGRYGRPPSTLRRRASASLDPDGGDSGITLRLGHTGPYDWPAMVGFLAARAIPGVERVEPGRYLRVVELHGQVGTIEVSPAPRHAALAATIRFPAVDALAAIVARIRWAFDLGADARAIAAHLSRDAILAPLVAARPGLRVPGAWDGFEMAVRAVLGQQVTVEAARLLCGRLAERYGEPLPAAQAAAVGLSRVFPRAEQLAAADLAGLGLPRARARALSALASAAVSDPRLLDPGRDLETSVARLRALPGIGEWTAQYIALRALHEPDAFPAADVGLQRAMEAPDGRRPAPHELEARAEPWRPWRGYAAQHLWTADASRSAVSRPSRRISSSAPGPPPAAAARPA